MMADEDSLQINDTAKTFCSILFDVMQQKGVGDVVCSPGSRNAPLLIAAAARQNMRKHVVIDERNAAFMALGMAMVSRKPVALVCTSGTALLNYAPAVAEAFYQSVPLIVISADRPEQWIDQDDSQTLRQFEALSNFVKKSYQLPAWGDDNSELQWYANRIANDAMIEATSRRNGPVHINVRLGEPLNGKTPHTTGRERVIDMLTADSIANKEVVKALAEEASRCKVMLVAGFLPPDEKLQKAVSEFCRLPNVTVMAETLSNLYVRYANDIDSVITAYDDAFLDSMAPDLVISIGGSLVSRKLKEYLRRNSGKCRHWSLGWNHTTSDVFQSITKRIEVDPARFLRLLTAFMAKMVDEDSEEAHFCIDWFNAKLEARSMKMHSVITLKEWCEMMALEEIFTSVPQAANLFLSNGTVVRYAQLLNNKKPHASYCNRGVSGIDGSISTAIGGAKAYGRMTVIVSGDMSMAYDLGSLALPEIPDSTRLIVIDNCGGGIFRFIPTTSGLDEREQYFCTRPQLPLRQLAEGYGWEYAEAASKRELNEALKTFFHEGKKKILRVVCDGELSAKVLKDYMNLKLKPEI